MPPATEKSTSSPSTSSVPARIDTVMPVPPVLRVIFGGDADTPSAPLAVTVPLLARVEPPGSFRLPPLVGKASVIPLAKVVVVAAADNVTLPADAASPTVNVPAVNTLAVDAKTVAPVLAL